MIIFRVPELKMVVPRDDQNVKTILVSGGAGYLGSTMVPLFLKEGYKVTIFDIFRWGSQSLLGILHDPNLTVIKGGHQVKNKL